MSERELGWRQKMLVSPNHFEIHVRLASAQGGQYYLVAMECYVPSSRELLAARTDVLPQGATFQDAVAVVKALTEWAVEELPTPGPFD